MADQPRALAAAVSDPGPYQVLEGELSKAGVALVVAPFETETALITAAQDVDGLFQHDPVPFTREVLRRLPRLKAICAQGIGVDRFDVEAATDLGIVVINLPRVLHREVAAHSMALLLYLSRKLGICHARITTWADEPALLPWPALGEAEPNHHIYGETLGLVSFGTIARTVATMARGFDVRVIAFDPFVAQADADEYGVQLVDLDTLCRESDLISIHTPLTPQTRNLIGDAQFRLMKPWAIVVNTGRGPVVDQDALIKALQEGRIAGAGIDVPGVEDEPQANPLFHMDTVIVTRTASVSDRTKVERWRWMGIEMGRVLSGKWPLYGLVNRTVTPRYPLAGD